MKETLDILVGDDAFSEFFTRQIFNGDYVSRLNEGITGYEVRIHTEETSEDVTREATMGKYDCVVTDLDYTGDGSGRQGYEVVDAVYEVSPRPLIILCTSSDNYSEIRGKAGDKIDYHTGMGKGHKFDDLVEVLIRHYTENSERGVNKMNKKLEILAIEDNPIHLEDLKKVVASRTDITVPHYAATLNRALGFLEQRSYDGILTDAMFPVYEGGAEETSGIQIINYACEHQIPFAVVTSLYHHNEAVSPVNAIMRANNKCYDLVDDRLSKEPGHKAWNVGINQIVNIANELKEGNMRFKDGKLDFNN